MLYTQYPASSDSHWLHTYMLRDDLGFQCPLLWPESPSQQEVWVSAKYLIALHNYLPILTLSQELKHL